MQHSLKISRKVEYGMRAMLFLASMPDGVATPFREIGRKMRVPQEFLAKILLQLSHARLVRSARGVHGGYALAKAPSTISFLDVIEALEGEVQVNLCSIPRSEECVHRESCTMLAVWQEGQRRMLEVYRGAKLNQLAMRSLGHQSPVAAATLRHARAPDLPGVR